MSWNVMLALLMGACAGSLLTLIYSLVYPTYMPIRALRGEGIAYSTFLSEVEAGRVREVMIRGSHVDGRYLNNSPFETYIPQTQVPMDRMVAKNVKVMTGRAEEDTSAISLLLLWLPYFLYLGAMWLWIARPLRAIARRLDGFPHASGVS